MELKTPAPSEILLCLSKPIELNVLFAQLSNQLTNSNIKSALILQLFTEKCLEKRLFLENIWGLWLLHKMVSNSIRVDFWLCFNALIAQPSYKIVSNQFLQMHQSTRGKTTTTNCVPPFPRFVWHLPAFIRQSLF